MCGRSSQLAACTPVVLGVVGRDGEQVDEVRMIIHALDILLACSEQKNPTYS
jgi:hypothetical protein